MNNRQRRKAKRRRAEARRLAQVRTGRRVNWWKAGHTLGLSLRFIKNYDPSKDRMSSYRDAILLEYLRTYDWTKDAPVTKGEESET